MIKIPVMLNSNYDIIHVENESRALLKNNLKLNTEYICKLSRGRSLKHNGLYWVILQALEKSHGNTAEGWHLYFKAKFLSMVEFTLKSGKKLLYPSSTAFNKLDQTGFDDYFNKFILWLAERGIDYMELINSVDI